MITGQEILWAYVLPAALVLVSCLGVAFTPRLKTGRWISNVVIAVIPAAAFALGFWQLHGWPGWVPADTTQWVMHFALLCIVIGLLRESHWMRWLCLMVLAVVFPWFLLKPIIQYDWTTPVAIAWITVYAMVILLHIGLLEHMARHLNAFRLSMILTMIAGATTVVLSLSGSLSLAKTSGILAAILLAAFLVSYWLPNKGFLLPLIPLFVVVMCGMWLSGFYYAKFNVINTILLSGSVLLAWLGMWIKLETRPAWQKFMVHACLAGAPLALAFVLALMQFMQNEANSY
ncbi:MAG: hypothetical protein K9N55_14640 [Phycisphaerae bacterium]|nr:hypothetical protein [Phycisphaerae bacterium]